MLDDQSAPHDTTDSSDNTSHPSSNDDTKHQQSKPPSVTGEESSSGSTPAEPMDIDSALGDVGLQGDPQSATPDPLDVNREIQQEDK